MNYEDQDDLDFFDNDSEDIEKLTDDEFFDIIEIERSKEEIEKIIDRVKRGSYEGNI